MTEREHFTRSPAFTAYLLLPLSGDTIDTFRSICTLKIKLKLTKKEEMIKAEETR